MKQEIRERIEKIRKGEVPEGYKETKVGIIPVDWEVKMLGEKTTKIGSGITPTGGEKVYKSEGRPFLRSQNVGWGNLILEDIAFIGDEIHNTFKATEIIKNDVFLNITGASIGRSAIADERVEMGNVNQHVCIIRTIENELNPKFLNYFLLSKNGQKQIDSYQAGGNRQGLNFGQIKSFQIPLPLIPEQQKIAEILITWDKAIELKEKLIEEKKELKKGAEKLLITGDVRFFSFNNEWSEMRIKDFTIQKPSIRAAGDLNETGLYPVYGASGIAGYDDTFDNDDEYVAIIKDGSGVGRVFLCEKKTSAIGTLTTIKANSKIDIGFVYLLMKNINYKKYITGNAIPHIYYKDYSKEHVKMPSLEEQRKIAYFSKILNQYIQNLEKELDQLKEQKKGLMQLLLTGIVRVEVN